MIDIKGLRKEKGLKQSELAELLGVKHNYVTHFETGSRTLPKHLYTKFIEIFGIETLAKYITEDLKNKTIPFYDVESTFHLKDFKLLLNDKPKFKLTIPLMNEADIAIMNQDNCMNPRVNMNDIILLKFPISKQPVYGNIYFVITDTFKSLRYIKKGVKIDTFLLTAENSHYDDLNIDSNELINLYLYIGRVGK